MQSFFLNMLFTVNWLLFVMYQFSSVPSMTNLHTDEYIRAARCTANIGASRFTMYGFGFRFWNSGFRFGLYFTLPFQNNTDGDRKYSFLRG